VHFHARARLVALMLERLLSHQDAARHLTISDFERIRRDARFLNDIWKQRDGHNIYDDKTSEKRISRGPTD
jgi:hypothetical protein